MHSGNSKMGRLNEQLAIKGIIGQFFVRKMIINIQILSNIILRYEFKKTLILRGKKFEWRRSLKMKLKSETHYEHIRRL
jgi:hypothetical protein